MAGIGAVGAVLAVWLTPLLVARVVPAGTPLHDEAREVFFLLSWSIPIVVLGAGVRGVLEAIKRFDFVNVVRVPTGVLTFLGPLAVLHFTPSVLGSVWLLIGVRVIVLGVYGAMCLREIPGLASPQRFDFSVLRQLMSFGAWITVSNLLAPLLLLVDRFLISARLTVSAVTYYATPFDAVTRVLIIPGAVASVLFPTFSAASAGDAPRLRRVYATALRAVFLLELPIVFIVVVFSPEILRLWLGQSFVGPSTAVMRWLMLGVLFNSLAQVAFSLVQGMGRADWTAKLHLAEAPLYLGLLFLLMRERGIEGAAIAWCVRATGDFIVLLIMARRLSHQAWSELLPRPSVPIALLAFVGVATGISSLGMRALMFVLLLPFVAASAYRWGTDEEQRAYLRARVARLWTNSSSPGAADASL
jgi:O-antigen/teichoic acid export membrane protein